MAGDDDEVFMTRSLNVTPKTTKQQLIVRIGKSIAYVTITISARRFVPLKLITDRHEASRGLLATAELLVVFLLPLMVNKDVQISQLIRPMNYL